MKRLTGLFLCGLLVVLAAAPADAMAAKRKGKLIKVEDSRYGPVLFDGKGRSIYLFTKEKGSRSRCYGDCAAAWPPVLTRAKPRAGRGVDASKLGRTRRGGGRRQVTYGGHPLYYYVADTAPGEITCQDVFEFGGTWYLVGPDGSAVT
jgi:predicted lipoprotein with Yx(FWY)xxD motif